MNDKINIYFGKYKINTILGLVSIGIAFYVALHTKIGTAYEWYFIIPGFFGVLLLIGRPLNFNDSSNIRLHLKKSIPRSLRYFLISLLLVGHESP